VVNIGQKTFNRDMDNYIKDRRKSPSFFKETSFRFTVEREQGGGSFLNKIFSREKKARIEVEEDLPIETHERTKAEVKEIEQEIDDYEELEEHIEHKREGAIGRLFRKIGLGGGQRHMDDYQGEDMGDEPFAFLTMQRDIKEALKIVNKWMGKLPPKKLQEFKNSEDFTRYKDLLKKHNLIK